MKIDEEDLKNSLDFLMSCELSIDFLNKFSIMRVMPPSDEITIKQFYDRWSESKSDFSNELKIPFNAGIILGYLMVGIVYTKENWFNLIPDLSLDLIDEDWGFKNKKPICTKSRPTLKYTIRRIRNSLSHRNVKFCPFDINKANMFNITNLLEIEFYDINEKDKNDTFEITLTYSDLNKFIVRFRKEIYKSIS